MYNWHVDFAHAVATWRDNNNEWWMGEWHNCLGPTFFKSWDDGGVPLDQVPEEILFQYEKWAKKTLGLDIKLIEVV